MKLLSYVLGNRVMVVAAVCLFVFNAGCDPNTAQEASQPAPSSLPEKVAPTAGRPKPIIADNKGPSEEAVAKVEESASMEEAVDKNIDEVKKSLARVILITTSKGCPCTKNRCQSGETALKAALAMYPEAPEMERLDNATEKEKSKELLSKFNAIMLPVVYFLDPDGNLLDKVEGELNFNEEKISEFLAEYDMGKD